MKKIVLSVAVVLVAGGLLAGCEQNQDQEQVNQQLQTRQGGNFGNGRSNKNNRRFVQGDYTVDASDNVQPRALLDAAKKGDLSADEKAGLIQMREEEKLAHDVYVTMYKKWGLNVFNNISGSEQTHTDTIKYLLDGYGVEDPVKDVAVGKFTDPKMQELYDSLVAQGNKSMIDALKVGATVEDLDIKDLEELLPKTDNEDIRIAYQNLNKGSRNHIRAFVRNLERNGETYTPQFISQARFDEIIAGDQERGSVDANGKATGIVGDGHGQGQGQGQGQGAGQGRGRNRR